jgi:hypothetical protein
MARRSNFLMTPNIAFERLDESSLYGYQQLLRKVEVGKVWKGGNKALAALLGIAYGRIPKLKEVLKREGFIKIVPGDSALSIPDEWHILDVFDYVQAPPSQNERGASENEQGQQGENIPPSQNERGQTSTNTDVPLVDYPRQNLNNPPSQNEQAPPSQNEQLLVNIFLKGNIQDTLKERETRAREAVQIFDNFFPDRILSEIQLKTVAAKIDNLPAWKEAVEYWALGGYTSFPKLLDKYHELDAARPMALAATADGGTHEPDDETFDVSIAVGTTVEFATAFFKDFGYEMRVVKVDGVDVDIGNDHDESRINVSVRGSEVIEILNVG